MAKAAKKKAKKTAKKAATTEKRGRGQPRKMTDEIKAAVLQQLKGGASFRMAASFVGIDHVTITNEAGRDPNFFTAVKEARLGSEELRNLIIEDTAYECALKAADNPKYQTSMIWYTKAKMGWSERPDEAAEAIGLLMRAAHGHSEN